MTNRFIIKTLVVLMAITLGVNLNAEAQKNKKGQNSSSQPQVGIPKANPNGDIVKFKYNNVEACSWNPATLELTMLIDEGGNKSGTIIKLDPNTGKFTTSLGEDKGSISNDGTIVSPNLGTLTLTEGGLIKRDAEMIGRITEGVTPNLFDMGVKVWYRDAPELIGRTINRNKVSPLLATYVYFGLLMTEHKLTKYLLGYDPTQKFTTNELNEMIKWNDEESINKIMQFESSRPYAGFKDTHPEFKDCKIGGIGLMEEKWNDGNNWWYIDYWVVYELTDGRNIVTFSTARKKFRYGDVEERFRKIKDRFNEVSDWKRK